MPVDFVLKNGKIVSKDQTVTAGLAVDDGVIVAVAKDDNLPKANRTIDCKGGFVLPGAIDPHVHFGAWFPFQDDCATETKAAALGGITTFIHHVIEGGSYLRAFADKKAAAELNSLIDFSFHFAVMSQQHLRELDKYVSLGVSSFKFFMAYRGKEGEQIGITAADDGLLFEGFRMIGQIGYPALPLVHAENVEIAHVLTEKLIADGRKDLAAWSEARPNFCEEENIVRAMSIAHLVHSPLYIVHVSTAEGVDAIGRMKRTMKVLTETTIHHLTITKDRNLGTSGKVAPPLREQKSLDALWQGIEHGIIDCLGSDHVPITREKKSGDIWSAPPGLPGIGLILPILVSEGVMKNRISMEKVVEVCSYNTAKAFGLYPRKGALEIGSDADIVLVDPRKKIKFTPQMLPSVADFSPYDGMEITGWPILTMARGRIVAEDGDIVNKPGTSKFLSRMPQQ